MSGGRARQYRLHVQGRSAQNATAMAAYPSTLFLAHQKHRLLWRLNGDRSAGAMAAAGFRWAMTSYFRNS